MIAVCRLSSASFLLCGASPLAINFIPITESAIADIANNNTINTKFIAFIIFLNILNKSFSNPNTSFGFSFKNLFEAVNASLTHVFLLEAAYTIV